MQTQSSVNKIASGLRGHGNDDDYAEDDDPHNHDQDQSLDDQDGNNDFDLDSNTGHHFEADSVD